MALYKQVLMSITVLIDRREEPGEGGDTAANVGSLQVVTVSAVRAVRRARVTLLVLLMTHIAVLWVRA